MSDPDHNVPESSQADTPDPDLKAAPTAPELDLKAAPTDPVAPPPELRGPPTVADSETPDN